MKLHSKAALALVLSACFATGANALGLSSASAKSALYEPLKAVVRISVDPGENVRAAKFKIASEEEHAKVFVPYSDYAKDLSVQVIYQNRTPYLYVTSKKPVYDPSLKIAINITLPNGGSAIVPVSVLLDTSYDSQMDAVPELSANVEALERLSAKTRVVSDASSVMSDPSKAQKPAKEKTVKVQKSAPTEKKNDAPLVVSSVEKESVVDSPSKKSTLEQGVKSVAPKADSAKADSAKADSAKADSAKADSAKVDSAKVDSAKVDSAKVDSAKASSGALAPEVKKDTVGAVSGAPLTLPPLPSLEQKDVKGGALGSGSTEEGTKGDSGNVKSVEPQGAEPKSTDAAVDEKKSEAEKRKEERKAKREAQAKKEKPVAPQEPEGSLLLDNLMPITAGAGGILAVLLGLLFIKRKKNKASSQEQETGVMATEDMDEKLDEYPTVAPKERALGFEDATMGDYEDAQRAMQEEKVAGALVTDASAGTVDDFADQLMNTLSSSSNNPLTKFEEDTLKDEIFNSSGDDDFISRMAKEVGSIAVPSASEQKAVKDMGVVGVIKDETVLHDPSQLALPKISAVQGEASKAVNSHEIDFEPQSFGPVDTPKDEFLMPGLDMDISTLSSLSTSNRVEPTLGRVEEPKGDEGLSFNLNDFSFNNQTSGSNPMSLDAFNLQAPSFGNSESEFSLEGVSSDIFESPVSGHSGKDFNISSGVPNDGEGRLQLELGVMYAQNEDWEGATSSLQEVLSSNDSKAFHAEAKRLLAMLPKI